MKMLIQKQDGYVLNTIATINMQDILGWYGLEPGWYRITIKQGGRNDPWYGEVSEIFKVKGEEGNRDD